MKGLLIMSKHYVYVAAPWINKAEALEAQKKFEAAGHVVTSKWITKHTDVDDPDDPKHYPELERQAIEDIDDINHSDTFVILNLNKSEGKATELGYALAYNDLAGVLAIYLVGEPSINIFYHHPDVGQYKSVEEVIECLKKS